MKAYISFSSLGYQKEPSEFIVNLHKICAFYARKNFGEIHLITDTLSLQYFKNIKWDSVSTFLDDVPKDYPQVWSLSKLYAFNHIAQKKEPFIHIDYDVIIWTKLKDSFLNSEVFVQSPEDILGHVYEIEKFIVNCPNRHLLKSTMPGFSYNMGIFGGTNTDFIAKYSKEAIDFVLDRQNAFFWKKYDKYSKGWCKAVLAEQYFLTGAAEYYNQKVTPLFPKWPTEEMAAVAGYTHLMQAKNQSNTKIKLQMLLDLIEKK